MRAVERGVRCVLRTFCKDKKIWVYVAFHQINGFAGHTITSFKFSHEIIGSPDKFASFHKTFTKRIVMTQQA